MIVIRYALRKRKARTFPNDNVGARDFYRRGVVEVRKPASANNFPKHYASIGDALHHASGSHHSLPASVIPVNGGRDPRHSDVSRAY